MDVSVTIAVEADAAELAAEPVEHEDKLHLAGSIRARAQQPAPARYGARAHRRRLPGVGADGAFTGIWACGPPRAL